MSDLRSWRLVTANLLLAGGYAALGLAFLLLVRETGVAAPVWPAAGLAFAAVLTFGWRVAPGIVLGSLVVNLPALQRVEPLDATLVAVAVAIAAGAALQAAAGAALVRRFVDSRLALATAGDIVRFLLLAGPVACVVNPTIALIAQAWAGMVPAAGPLTVWVTWWVGDSLGVVVFGPLALMLMPTWRSAWHGRRLAVAVPSVAVTLILVSFFLSGAAVTQSERDRQVGRLGLEARAALEVTLERHEQALSGIAGLITSSEEVTPREFESFTRGSLSRGDGLQALAWDTAVPGDELEAFVRRMLAVDGVSDFSVTELGDGGALVPVGDRPLHVIVTLIEPLAENAAAVGFDIMSGPVRAVTARDAQASGEARTTGPIDLVVEAAQQKGVLVLLPVYRDGRVPTNPAMRESDLLGFAVGAYRLGDLLDAAFAGEQWDGVSIALTDVTAGDEPVVIAQRGDIGDASRVGLARQIIDVGGRSWELRIQPSLGVEGVEPVTYSPGVLVGGLAVGVLLEAFLLLLTGTERLARREAEVRGFEANHDSLTGLLNRRAFIELLQVACNRAEAEASRHVLLFMDLDGFKQVNDVAGHEAGDQMLKAVATSLLGTMRERDIVARIGGDEFGVILSNCPEERGLEIAEALVRSVSFARPDGYPDAPGVQLSVGLVMVDGAHPLGIDQLLRRADQACYQAKHDGPGQVRRFDDVDGSEEPARTRSATAPRD